jgi:hypothetical protein
MRAAGIPTRIVTGYQGGEVNPFNNELIVRQADAHAWTEIWLEDKGWIRVDPTAAVSPLRVEGGVNAALGPIGAMSSLIAADAFGLLSQLRFAWQMMNSQWDQWVVGYNMDRQRQFFSQMGFAGIDWRTLGFWLVIITFAVGTAITLGLLVRDRPPRREASLVAWNRFCAKLAVAGLARAPHEGPLDFLARVRQVRPELAPWWRTSPRATSRRVTAAALRRTRCASSRAACASSARHECGRAGAPQRPLPLRQRRRYKDCHGRSRAGAAALERWCSARCSCTSRARSTRPSAAIARSWARSRQRRRHALPRHGRVAARRLAAAERLMRDSIAANAPIPDFHNNLGLLLRDTGRATRRSRASRRARGRSRLVRGLQQLGLALEAAAAGTRRAQLPRGDRATPRFAAARQNLAARSSRSGDFREAGRIPLAARRPGPDAHARRDRGAAAASLAGRASRCAPSRASATCSSSCASPRARAARRAPRVPRRSAPAPMLARTGLFALGSRRRTCAPGSKRLRRRPAVAPRADDPRDFPPPLPLTPGPSVSRMREAARRSGPRRWIALTWRGGVAPGPSRTQLKEVDPETLGGALRGRRATWISVQRNPAHGRARAPLVRARRAGAPTSAPPTATLEEMLALQSLLDGLHRWSATPNSHLRAGLAKPMQVLVAHPPNGRWGIAGGALRVVPGGARCIASAGTATGAKRSLHCRQDFDRIHRFPCAPAPRSEASPGRCRRSPSRRSSGPCARPAAPSRGSCRCARRPRATCCCA